MTKQEPPRNDLPHQKVLFKLVRDCERIIVLMKSGRDIDGELLKKITLRAEINLVKWKQEPGSKPSKLELPLTKVLLELVGHFE